MSGAVKKLEEFSDVKIQGEEQGKDKGNVNAEKPAIKLKLVTQKTESNVTTEKEGSERFLTPQITLDSQFFATSQSKLFIILENIIHERDDEDSCKNDKKARVSDFLDIPQYEFDQDYDSLESSEDDPEGEENDSSEGDFQKEVQQNKENFLNVSFIKSYLR